MAGFVLAYFVVLFEERRESDRVRREERRESIRALTQLAELLGEVGPLRQAGREHLLTGVTGEAAEPAVLTAAFPAGVLMNALPGDHPVAVAFGRWTTGYIAAEMAAVFADGTEVSQLLVEERAAWFSLKDSML